MDTSVVISAAGMGSRLGLNIPKSLVSVAGRSILDWQLTDICRDVEKVWVVVGYMADEVIALARSIRPDIGILVNERWGTTKTAASLSMGASRVSGRCVSLDGDLLVHPFDFNEMLKSPENLVGVCPPSSSHPVYVATNNQSMCQGFSYEIPSEWEWTGLLNFDPAQISPGDGNVYELVERILPVKILNVRCVEIDTPEDLVRANRDWQSILRG